MIGRIVAIAAVLAAGSASADGLKIPVGDLGQPAQARAFDQRLTAAARQFCEDRYSPADLSGLAACEKAVREEALDQLTPAQQHAYAVARPTSPQG